MKTRPGSKYSPSTNEQIQSLARKAVRSYGSAEKLLRAAASQVPEVKLFLRDAGRLVEEILTHNRTRGRPRTQGERDYRVYLLRGMSAAGKKKLDELLDEMLTEASGTEPQNSYCKGRRSPKWTYDDHATLFNKVYHPDQPLTGRDVERILKRYEERQTKAISALLIHLPALRKFLEADSTPARRTPAGFFNVVSPGTKFNKNLRSSGQEDW
jgi:hypothetical protein